MTEPWYRRWFGEDYLALYAHRSEGEAERQVDASIALFDGAPGELSPLLDVACGSARHTRAFAARGVRSVGLDLSAALLGRALGERESVQHDLVRADMLHLPFRSGAFGAVVSFFTSIGYFERDEENAQVLREMARVLRPGGRLALDFFNPDVTIPALVAEEEQQLGERRVRIRRWFDESRRRIEKEIVFLDEADGARFRESVRAFRREELVDLLGAAGLPVEICADEREDGTIAPCGAGSPRFLFVSRKPGD